jgi:hypothetical protein
VANAIDYVERKKGSPMVVPMEVVVGTNSVVGVLILILIILGIVYLIRRV